MKIADLQASEGIGGYYWNDQEAIQAGAVLDGFVYRGFPITPGFTQIRQPSKTILLTLILDDGLYFHGDCCSVAQGARSSRDPLLDPGVLIHLIETELLGALRGQEVHQFRELAEFIDGLEISGHALHSAVRYGLTQAILQATAAVRGLTMAEVLSEEYGIPLTDEPCSILGSCSGHWYSNIDKAILHRLFAIQSAMFRMDEFDLLLDYVKWMNKRIQNLGGKEYKPVLHYDLHGLLGEKAEMDFQRMLKYFQDIENAASPYTVLIEDPFDVGNRDSQIEMMAAFRQALRRNKNSVILIADEWCNVLEDLQLFVQASAMDGVQLKMPDLGGINNTMDAALLCKKYGIKIYLGGSCTETDLSARVTAHIALVTQPFETLSKPGLGFDEGVMILRNEMVRTIRLYQERKSWGERSVS
jgi:methylaspartate ammonia-lyase